MAVKWTQKKNDHAIRICLSLSVALLAASTIIPIDSRGEDDAVTESPHAVESLPGTVEEARGRARWLHEAMLGTLKVMHRDFFDEEETNRIPSASLEDVFAEMARSWLVEIRWLGVDATKDIDHEPRDRFEEAAVVALAEGKPEYEETWKDSFRYAGAIPLQNECLKCHVPDRTSLEDRVAGLSISIPLALPHNDETEKE